MSALPDRLVLPASLRESIERRARVAHPREGCGLLLGTEGDTPEAAQVHRVVHARNLDSRLGRFELDPGRVVAATHRAALLGLRILGLWHSHPDCAARPSRADLERLWPGWLSLILATRNARAHELRCFSIRDGALFELDLLEAEPDPDHP
ncbi:MAG TPA: M67 family peptidase [Planctomycetes bacterium]|nr:M67 family peptidase [Planctomycetota bacterium]